MMVFSKQNGRKINLSPFFDLSQDLIKDEGA